MEEHGQLAAGFQAAAAIGLATAIGRIVSQRLKVPIPLLLLLTGMALGRDGLDVVRTDDLTGWAPIAIALAVALIVFEGGTGIDARSLRKLAPVVRNLVIGGLVVTPLIGMFAAHYVAEFPLRVSALFGALVAVTGPSVINPLLRTVKVNRTVRGILVAEGVIIDPFGALLTFFLLQVAIADSFDPTGPARWVIGRVALGIACGIGGSLLLFAVLRLVRRLQVLEVSLLLLGVAVATFGIAESLGSESGLTAMVLMGITVGTVAVPHREEVEHFAETLISFLVATVYIMLAASIEVSSIADLWPRGFIVVAILMFVARPILVFLSSTGSGISIGEKLFLSAVAPRGVVAASLASVVAIEASGRLGADADLFVALVFLVILLTIAVQSAYAAPLARLLKVYPVPTIVAGYGEIGARLAGRLRDAGESVVVVESDDERAVRGRDDGFEVIFGDIASQEVLKKAGVNEAKSLILVTGSDDRNLMAAQIARSLGCERLYALVRDANNMPAFEEAGIEAVGLQSAAADELLGMIGGSPLSDVLLDPGDDVSILRIRVTNPTARGKLQAIAGLRGALVILIRRGPRTIIPSGGTEVQFGDVVTVMAPRTVVERVRRVLEGESE